jgi:hypothetical protein
MAATGQSNAVSAPAFVLKVLLLLLLAAAAAARGNTPQSTATPKMLHMT